jgi:hypothetical protein
VEVVLMARREHSLCEDAGGECCSDFTRCPWNCQAKAELHQADGGHEFNRGIVFPIERDATPYEASEAATDRAVLTAQLLMVGLCLLARRWSITSPEGGRLE